LSKNSGITSPEISDLFHQGRKTGRKDHTAMHPMTSRTGAVPLSLALSIAALTAAVPAHAQFSFTTGDLVVSVEGDGSNTGSYGDNQAAPLTLDQFAINGTSSATAAGSLMLPQTTVGAQYAISGEYGSSSEGTLQLSGNGQYLTIMGYGVNADAFNADPGAYGGVPGNTALAQSASADVARVVALIGANGSVDTSTALTNVFDQNNPRSAYTVDGTSFYVSGQGNSPDATGGVFYASLGSTTATAITGLDTSSKTSSQDTRDVQIYNGTLYVSVDSKEGSGSNRSFIGTLGTPPATTLYNNGSGPTQLTGFGTSATGKLTITSGANGDGNGLNAGQAINLSPENYFFANATTLYVADSGDPKNNSNCSGSSCVSIGDGGLQKWSLVGGTWELDYTLANGLGLVSNANGTATAGSSGLYGLTGKVVGSTVELFATNYTLSDLNQTFLYGISDSLSATEASQVTGESFTELAAAPADSTFKGVSFAPTAAPVPEMASLWFALSGAGILGLLIRRKSSVTAAR